jgi:hypothetical protein
VCGRLKYSKSKPVLGPSCVAAGTAPWAPKPVVRWSRGKTERGHQPPFGERGVHDAQIIDSESPFRRRNRITMTRSALTVTENGAVDEFGSAAVLSAALASCQHAVERWEAPTMVDRATVWVAMVLFVSTSGCLCSGLKLGCPAIAKFDAQPRTTCAGRPVTLSWDTTGATVLVPTPAAACHDADGHDAGQACVVTRDTLFQLQASRGGSTVRAEQEVEVVPRDGREFAIGERTQCAGSEVVAVATLPPQAWDATVRVDRVVADTDRRLTIVHDDRSAVLQPNADTTEVFRGTPVGGAWTLRAPIAPGETCDSPAGGARAPRPPDALGASVFVTCGK